MGGSALPTPPVIKVVLLHTEKIVQRHFGSSVCMDFLFIFIKIHKFFIERPPIFLIWCFPCAHIIIILDNWHHGFFWSVSETFLFKKIGVFWRVHSWKSFGKECFWKHSSPQYTPTRLRLSTLRPNEKCSLRFLWNNYSVSTACHVLSRVFYQQIWVHL